MKNMAMLILTVAVMIFFTVIALPVLWMVDFASPWMGNKKTRRQ
jgi:hypothetical protein